jgi:chemotaxis protein CheD
MSTPAIRSRIGQMLDKPPNLLPGFEAGFEHIKRYWDPKRHVYAAKILPGEYYVTVHDEMIVTVLGSCVSACIRDTVLGIGGMNHFMLPVKSTAETERWQRDSVSAANRYGNFAMEHLINDILKRGSSRKALEVKIFGGGRILAQMTDIGRRNIAFVREYIHTEGLQLAAEDVGDKYPRKVLYFPASGKVQVKKLRSQHNDTIVERETRYLGRLSRPIEGEIELF